MGLNEEALQTDVEALNMYKQLVEQDPAAYTLDLAMTLHNQVVKLPKLGLKEEAFQECRDALEMYKELASQNPVAFNPYFAKASYSKKKLCTYVKKLQSCSGNLQSNTPMLLIRTWQILCTTFL